MDYGKGGATLPTTAGLITGAALPVTGATSNVVVIVASAVAIALVIWGVVYAVKQRVR